MRTIAIVILAAALSACTSITLVQPGVGGFAAVEFLRAVQIQDHSINVYTFDAGSRFIADRYGSDGKPVYCGLASINQDGRPFNVCFGFEEPSTIILGPGASLGREVRRPQPEGTIRHSTAKF